MNNKNFAKVRSYEIGIYTSLLSRQCINKALDVIDQDQTVLESVFSRAWFFSFIVLMFQLTKEHLFFWFPLCMFHKILHYVQT